jgi:hypothetical protein
MGLYEKILAERVEEERRRGRPLGRFYGLDAPALDRLLTNAPEEQPKYGADLRKLHRYIRKGMHSPGAGMRFMSLKKKYSKKYAELKAEAQGQRELL